MMFTIYYLTVDSTMFCYQIDVLVLPSRELLKDVYLGLVLLEVY
jgi:hypothetical protein